MKLYEEKLKRKVKYEGHLVDVYEDEVLIHDKNTHAIREVVNHSGGVCVAAKTVNNKYLMVQQYRYAQEAVGLEFIAGKKEPNEDPFLSIQRELLEEGGVIAHTWRDLGQSFPSPAYLNEKIHLYTAEDLELKAQNLDDEEVMILKEYALEEIISMIEQGEIQDLKTIALAYRLAYEYKI
ncbi:MAG TPA: NUDIX hydrolase [Erysipelothrix sp.]|nr:NUDIX hydrolase [Erysipelothrix sp.]